MGEIAWGPLAEEFSKLSLSDKERPIRLRLANSLSELNKALMAHRMEFSSVMCDGVHGYLTCVSNRSDLPTKSFIGLPIEVQIVTDTGNLQTLCAIVKSARLGQSDGSLCLIQLELVDGLSLMEDCVQSRVFLNKTPLQVIEVLFSEWRQRSNTMASCLGLDTAGVLATYPTREFFLQWNEGSGSFIKRLLKQAGISWHIRSGIDRPGPTTGDDTPAHTVVLFDDPTTLPANPANSLRFHRHDGTEQRDSIVLWSPNRRLTPGSVTRKSWDYKSAHMSSGQATSSQQQGEAGDDLARLLRHAVVEMPHAGDTETDHDQLTMRRMQRLEFESKCVDGISGVRQMNCGEWNEVTGHPDVDSHPQHEREFIFTEVHHYAENNLPKSIDETAQTLLQSSHQLPDWITNAPKTGPSRHYMNRFKAVRRGIPIVPPWNPSEDFPSLNEVTGVIVGPENTEVYTDELGRFRVQIAGLLAEDHEHASGAGTTGFHCDSAWIRADWGWAGSGYGNIQPLRVGMEVAIGFESGDPSRPFISRVLYNGRNRPPRFSNTGQLPGNSWLSGTKTKEINGEQYNQLRFDDTPGAVSSQLASTHASSQLNLGHLTHPRSDVRGNPRGEGAELRSDGATAIRGQQGVLISAEAQPQANGSMLDRTALLTLAEALLNIQKNLGELSETHQAESTDANKLSTLIQKLKTWEEGTNTSPHGHEGGAAAIAVTAPDGIAVASQQNVFVGAQTHIDTVSTGNTQITAGRQLLMRCSELWSAFAHKAIKLIAGEGDIQIAAHKRNVEINAAERILLTAGIEVVIQAPKVTWIAQGVQVDMGRGTMVQQCSGDYVIKSATFAQLGPGNGLPANLNLPITTPVHDQQVVLRWLGTDAPMKNQPYRITTEDGQVLEGRTNAQGLTEKFTSSIPFGNYKIEPLDD